MFFASRTSLIKSGTRAFSTSRTAAMDMARVTLIGRLGADPVERKSANGRPYLSYSVATAPGVPYENEAGKKVEPHTSWHTVFAFNENTHQAIKRVGKGSTVYVEAELHVQPSTPTKDGSYVPGAVWLRHQKINVLNRVKPAEGGAPEARSSSAPGTV